MNRMSEVMGKKRGKKKAANATEDVNGSTKLVRVKDDLAEKIGWLVEFDQIENTAIFLDPLIRPQIEALYNPIEPLVKDIKAVKERAKQIGKGSRAKRT